LFCHHRNAAAHARENYFLIRLQQITASPGNKLFTAIASRVKNISRIISAIFPQMLCECGITVA